MMPNRPLLMIPGPVEVSPAVLEAYSGPPPSHLAPHVIEAFGRSVEQMRDVWCAGPDSQPFIAAGSGTLAMEMAVTNLVDPGQRAVVVNTGYFGDRMTEMLRRRGARVAEVSAEVGDTAPFEAVEDALASDETSVLYATHVDTSTGVRVDVERLARLARSHGALSVFDGVCATGGERFEMQSWAADVYLTASQKAIGLPPGLALMVVSPRALSARRTLKTPPPMATDWLEWLPIMEAYQARRPSYFSTPATNLICALEVGLSEISDAGIIERFELHRLTAEALRAAWRALDLELFCAGDDVAASTLSAIRYPASVDASLVATLASEGVVAAGGLYPGRQHEYFRIGHMGWIITRPDLVLDAVSALERALDACGHTVEPGAGRRAAAATLGSTSVHK